MSYPTDDDLRQTIVEWAEYCQLLYADIDAPVQPGVKVQASKIITEGRAGGVTKYGKYGWCGDFVSYILTFAGADPLLQNRVSVSGTWKIGQNISMIIARGRQLGAYKPMSAALPGDVVVIDRPAGGHVDIVVGTPASGQLPVIGGNIADAVGSATRVADEIVCVLDVVQLTREAKRGPAFTSAVDATTGLPVAPQLYSADPITAPLPPLGTPVSYPGYPLPSIEDLIVIFGGGPEAQPTLPASAGAIGAATAAQLGELAASLGLPSPLGVPTAAALPAVVDAAAAAASIFGLPALYAPGDLPAVLPPEWRDKIALLSPLLFLTKAGNG